MNTLYYGDNLKVLREYIRDESVDLIYLDPPFNSNRSYNVLFKDESGASSDAQITAFDDSWHWGPQAQETYEDLLRNGPPAVADMIDALHKFIAGGRAGHGNQMMAYLVMMTARLVELHRVLKPTGSLYLHCDPTASHYLKILMDMIFGPENFRNEIVWKRTTAHNDPKRWGNVHDVLFFYSKRQNPTWNPVFMEHSDEYKQRFKHKDPDGRVWTDGDLTAKGLSGGGYTCEYKGFTSLWRVPIETMKRLDEENKLYFTKTGGIRIKRYLDDLQGVTIQDVITDIFPINSQAAERLGYPTQKPLELLERIINASSNPGDVVLDPFSGCGTCIAAAQKLGRQWIGIDITHLAIAMHKSRLKTMYGLQPKIDYRIIGEPEDLPGARQLAADDRFQFEAWAISLVNAQPMNRPTNTEPGARGVHKGADKGIDGVINFLDDRKGGLKHALVQVKSGHVKSGDVRDLVGTLDREKAEVGIFITLENPTREMVAEALKAGSYHSEIWQKDYPRVQILSIVQLLNGEEVKLPLTPPAAGPYKPAEKVKKSGSKQGELDL